MDAVPRRLDAFDRATLWPARAMYATLLQPSRALLDFPVAAGMSLSVGKTVSDALSSGYAVALAPFQPSASYLCAVEQPAARAYMAYGRLDRDGRLEYLCTRRLGARSRLVVTGVSSARRRHASHISYRWQRVGERALGSGSSGSTEEEDKDEDVRRWGVELSFHSLGAIFGVQALRRLGTSWSVGGELYYLAQEVSGGLSVGVRHDSTQALLPQTTARVGGQHTRTSTTLTLNPLLGHVACTHTAQLAAALWGSARYESNVHSYDSDVSVGVQYHAGHGRDKDNSTACDGGGGADRESVVRVNCSTRRGLALVWEETWHARGRGRWKAAVGVATELQQSVPRRTLGIDVQCEW